VRAEFPNAVMTEVADGWEEHWRDFHQPVRIGELWIGPPWHSVPPHAVPVVIDPGRAFGTGAHPTTRLCLELLLEQERGTVLDIGCGSGVIAIAAARLGFAAVRAVDVDETAVEVTRENARLNRVELAVERVAARTEPLPQADIAVANVSLEAVETIAELVESAQLITAGYLVRDRPEAPRFRHIMRRELDGWAADLFAR
jgi:ribosomal protein L11 methyltransferase